MEPTITYNSIVNKVSWTSLTPAYDSYNIALRLGLKTGYPAISTFNLKVTNFCPATTLTAPVTPFVETYVPYVISGGSNSYTFNAFTTTVAGCPITYNLVIANTNALQPSSLFTFN